MGEVFFHIDLDAFFASVEILDHPEYRGKPLIIGTPGPRHVASTCSYEARKYGVHSAMPMTTALKLCPDAICSLHSMILLLRKSSVRLPAPFILKKRPASSTFIRQATCK